MGTFTRDEFTNRLWDLIATAARSNGIDPADLWREIGLAQGFDTVPRRPLRADELWFN